MERQSLRKEVSYEKHYTDRKGLLSLRTENLSGTASHIRRNSEQENQRERRILGLALGSAMIATPEQKTAPSMTRTRTIT